MNQIEWNDIPDDDIESMSIDRLGMHTLHHINRDISSDWHIGNILAFLSGYSDQGDIRSEAAQQAIAESINWLFNSGLLGRNPPPSLRRGHNADSIFVTREGQNSLDDVEIGLLSIKAGQLLGDHLHSQLQDILTLFLYSRYGSTVFEALRTVEARVRELARPRDRRTGGVQLMKYAFGEKGPLTDPAWQKGWSDGMRDLFVGAFAVYRNDAAHARNREMYQDPVEVAEIVLLANLLHRHLDRVEQRLSTQDTQTDS